MLEERVPVFSVGMGNPSAEMVEACHWHAIKVIAMVTTAEDARVVEATGRVFNSDFSARHPKCPSKRASG